MTVRNPRILTRRRVLIAGVSVPIPFLLFGCSSSDSGNGAAATRETATAGATATTRVSGTASPTAQATSTLAPTPACTDDDDDPTPAQTEGPYFTPNSPERTVLYEAGITGTKLLLTGSVVSTGCRAIAGALIDFWQCDGNGVYDNAGYRLRGHQFTDANGSFRLETVVPGLYPGRTRHIHVKVQAPSRPVLTTQLYFPGEPRNQQDGIYRAECLIADYRDGSGGKQGAFQFVLAV